MAKDYAKGLAPAQLTLTPKATKPKQSEVEAYAFIRQQLRDLGWIVKDPSKAGNGQVWTQNQCHGDAHLKLAFDKVRPENIVKLSEKLVWVIEAKASRRELAKALSEATDFYCERSTERMGSTKRSWQPASRVMRNTGI
jgi:type I restriction enzyme M protein